MYFKIRVNQVYFKIRMNQVYFKIWVNQVYFKIRVNLVDSYIFQKIFFDDRGGWNLVSNIGADFILGVTEHFLEPQQRLNHSGQVHCCLW